MLKSLVKRRRELLLLMSLSLLKLVGMRSLMTHLPKFESK
jgi:hypothetical protein